MTVCTCNGMYPHERDCGKELDEAQRPVLLDLFCGAGGCSVGYHRAGFRVKGVDMKPRRTDRNPQARDDNRADTTTLPADRHWFVAGEGGYCAACNLPQRNRRHAPRAA